MKTLAILLIAVAGLSNVNAQSKKPVLNHIAIYVMDLKKSTAFYRDIVQIDTMPEPFHDGKHTWFRVSDVSHLHLIEGAKSIQNHDINSHLCFSVDSLDEVIARLNKHNVKFRDWAGKPQAVTTRVDGVKQIYFQDPDGYWLEMNDAKE
jgi:lactoylglutathione lyase